MRNLEELIEEVRFNTNNVNSNRFTDEALIRFFNQAQRRIQNIVFLSNPTADHFVKSYDFDYSSNTEEYGLPSDTYADNAVINVFELSSSDEQSYPLEKILDRERNTKAGYILRNRKIIIPSGSVSGGTPQLRVVYVKQLPSMESVSDVPELPTICEDLLTAWVERKIQAVDSSSDVQNANLFTKEEEELLAKVFADSSQDIKYPPITNPDYVSY